MTTQRHKGRFRSRFTDDARWLMIRLVTTEVRPSDPTSVTQADFDANAPTIIARLQPDWPEPPTARALWMKLTKDDPAPKRSWEQLIATAVGARSIAHTASAATREEPLPDWFEEPHIVYAVRRVHVQLGKPHTVTIDQYESGRGELIASVRGERREQLLLLLPSGHQLAALADGDWNVILALCGLPPVVAQGAERGHPLVLLAWHYYETENRLPSYNRLARHFLARGLAVPVAVKPWSNVHDEITRLRAERGWTTPATGPADDQQLDEAELAELLDGAPGRHRPHGYWTAERIVEA